MTHAEPRMYIALCNCPPDKAPDIARTLVERRLAACVNLLPGVRSFYRWEGESCDDSESMLIIKVSVSEVDRMRVELAAMHPYSVPEILILPIDAARSFRPYVDWVVDECGSDAS